MEGGTRDAPDRVSTSVFWPILPPWSSLLPPPPPPPPLPLPLPSPIPPCVLGQQPQPPPPYSPPPPHSHEHMRVSSSAASIISCNMLDSELQPTCERHRQVHPARSVQACMRVRAHAEGSPDLLNGRRCCPEDKGTARRCCLRGNTSAPRGNTSGALPNTSAPEVLPRRQGYSETCSMGGGVAPKTRVQL